MLGYIWQLIINGVLSYFGVTITYDPSYGFWGLVVLMNWQMIGYMMIIYIAGIGNIPKDLIDAAKVDEIVEYVENELVGITYDPTVGVLSRKYVDDIKLTQCAHIFWYAYYKHGFDIDSNGGAVVTPKDISNSEYFDVIQVSGFDPQTLWSN